MKKLPKNCNRCHNKCPADHLKCGKGRAYFKSLQRKLDEKEVAGDKLSKSVEDEADYKYEAHHKHEADHKHEAHHKHGSHHKHGNEYSHKHDHKNKSELGYLIKLCRHRLHHRQKENKDVDEWIGRRLSAEEQGTLKTLLGKLLE